jgi:hypothetical protein
MDEQLEQMQARIDVFANKLSAAYEVESQYVFAMRKKDQEIADLKEEIDVLKNQESS